MIAWAANNSQSEHLDLFLEVADDKNRTALHIAASRGHLSVLKLLISYGANIHALTSTNNTVLHMACASPNAKLELIEFLINYGIDMELRYVICKE